MTSLLTSRAAIVSGLTLARESSPVIFPHHGDKRNVRGRAWFIELHGDWIWVKSQVGHGSTFTFTLPTS